MFASQGKRLRHHLGIKDREQADYFSRPISNAWREAFAACIQEAGKPRRYAEVRILVEPVR